MFSPLPVTKLKQKFALLLQHLLLASPKKQKVYPFNSLGYDLYGSAEDEQPARPRSGYDWLLLAACVTASLLLVGLAVAATFVLAENSLR